MKFVDLLNWGVQHMELKKSTENELIGRIIEDFAEAKTIMLVSYKGIRGGQRDIRGAHKNAIPIPRVG